MFVNNSNKLTQAKGLLYSKILNIKEAINLIVSGKIINYRYDDKSENIVER